MAANPSIQIACQARCDKEMLLPMERKWLLRVYLWNVWKPGSLQAGLCDMPLIQSCLSNNKKDYGPMAEQRILASWIGHADLLAMIDDLGEAGEELRKAAKIGGKYGEKPGPLKTAVTEGQFDHVHLLSNYPDAVHKPFAKWLGCKPVVHLVELADPTDYDGIFRCTNRVLGEVSATIARKRGKLCILLSPGTPAMAVVWVLLGKSRYPATFYQTGRGKLHEARIPSDLFEEVVPELLRDRDIALQHLASRNPSEVEGFE